MQTLLNLTFLSCLAVLKKNHYSTIKTIFLCGTLQEFGSFVGKSFLYLYTSNSRLVITQLNEAQIMWNTW